jgi:DNA-binding NarL/FixJ family response regulator
MGDFAVLPDQKRSFVALVRVLLADDHAGVLAYTQAKLGKVFEIVGTVEDGAQAVDATLQLDPDVSQPTW